MEWSSTSICVGAAAFLHNTGRQEHRGGRDLRERLDRMRSPLQDSQGRRDLKARHSSPGESPRSLGKRIDRNHTRRKHVDNNHDYSGNISDGSEDPLRDRRRTSSDAKMCIDAQLREMLSEIKSLENHKQQLEAVIQNVELKQKMFTELEKFCPPHCILASNSSTIHLNLIGEKTRFQDRIIGAHFFSPAHIMPLLELVRTQQTSPQTIVDLLDLGKKIKKTPVVVGNCTGFAEDVLSLHSICSYTC